jgi:hypothetical protein
MKNKEKCRGIYCHKSSPFFRIILIFVPIIIHAEGTTTLETIVSSITADTSVINAARQYQLSLIDDRYHSLQWWSPSLTLSNNLIFPFEEDEFDDKATGNTASLDLSLPLPTGSTLSIGGSYALNRDLLESSTLERQDWGYAQEIGFNIGLSQSLNPWWLHGHHSPYSRLTTIQSALSKNDYNIAIKNNLFSSVQSYITLRKIERTISQIQNTLAFYDELLEDYQELFTSGGISLREYEKIRSEKWEYESELFNMESSRLSAQRELYRLTGTFIEKVYAEPLIEVDAPVFTQVFMDIQKTEITSLEQTNLFLSRENLQINRTLDRQTHSPGFKVTWGTKYVLPVQEANSLWDAWEEEKNFTDNKLNNWSLTITFDISPLLSPINRRNTRRFNQETRTIDELLRTVSIERQKEKELTALTISQLEEQIRRLSEIVLNESFRIQEDENSKNTGAITVLDYKQRLISFEEKQTTLFNLHDDLWFYTFIRLFY